MAWLRYGPGRDKPGRPGWTETTQQNGQVEHKVSVVDLIKQASKTDTKQLDTTRPEGDLVDDTGLWV